MKENFNALDGYRGLAALFVAASHVPEYWGFPLLPRAPLAVDLFFLLSGFVIAHSYEHKLATRQMSVGDFMLVRWVRLYPMYLVSLLLAAALTLTGLLVHHQRSMHVELEYIAAAVAALFVLPMRISDTLAFFPLNTAYWSLFFEFLMNFIYATLLPTLTNRVLVTLVAISAAALALIAHDNGAGGVILGSFWGWESVSGGLVRSVFGIFAGVLMYRMRARIPATCLGTGYRLPMVVIAAVLATPLIGHNDWAIQLLAIFVLFPLCIARVVCGPQPPKSRVLHIFGIASYPIYVLHLPLAHAVDILSLKRFSHLAPFSGMAMLVLTFAVALFCARKIDAPIRRALAAKVFHEVQSPALKPS